MFRKITKVTKGSWASRCLVCHFRSHECRQATSLRLEAQCAHPWTPSLTLRAWVLNYSGKFTLAALLKLVCQKQRLTWGTLLTMSIFCRLILNFCHTLYIYHDTHPGKRCPESVYGWFYITHINVYASVRMRHSVDFRQAMSCRIVLVSMFYDLGYMVWDHPK